MAVAFSGEDEMEGFGMLTGVAPATELPVVDIKWKEARVFEEVSGYTIVLSAALGVERIKVEVTPSLATDFKFEKEFGDILLKVAGFGRMPFANILQVIGNALNGNESMTVTLTANDSDGIDLDIEISMGLFQTEYKLSLERKTLSLSDVLSAQLRTAKDETAAVRIENLELMQRMDAAIAKGDAIHKQLVAATTKTEALEQRMTEEKAASKKELTKATEELRVIHSELDTTKERSEALSKQLEANELQFADLRREIGIRESRIGELQKRVASHSALFFNPAISTALVSSDGSTAEWTEDGAFALLAPTMRTDFELKLVVDKMLADSDFELLMMCGSELEEIHKCGTGFQSNGLVTVDGSELPGTQAFGPLQQGDEVVMSVQRSTDTVSIRSRHGEYTCKWKASEPIIHIVIACEKRGVALRIV